MFKKIPDIRLIIISLLVVISACGRVYRDQSGEPIKAIKIGNQIWMAENLSVTIFRNGDIIPEADSPDEWIQYGRTGKPAWCYQRNNIANGRKYGKLYNWYAVNDPRGLAPEGWHVATDEEWSQLIAALGGPTLAAFRIRTTESPDSTKSKIGFSAAAGGGRNNAGNFFGLGSHGYWWTSSEMNTSQSMIRLLNYLDCNIYILYYDKSYGFSVRCIKD